jgi:hypothetical protein
MSILPKKAHHPIYFIATLLLGIAIGNKILFWRLQQQALDHSEIYMLGMTVLILIILVFRDRLFETNSIRNLEEMKNNTSQSVTNLEKWIKHNLSPIIVSLETNELVLEQANDIINFALTEDKADHQYLMYVGSGDLYKDPPPTEETESHTAIGDYMGTMSLVTSNRLNVTRYISLLDPAEYKKRDPEVREAYLRWLKKQISLLERNPNYVFFNCLRAPKWGSSRSSIFTERAVLDVIGNGLSGVLIRGEQVARTLREGSQTLFINAANKPEQYSKSLLETYVGELGEPLDQGFLTR